MEKKEKQTSCEGDPFDLSDTFLTDKEYVGDSTKSSDKASQQYSPWREVNHLSLSGSDACKGTDKRLRYNAPSTDSPISRGRQ